MAFMQVINFDSASCTPSSFTGDADAAFSVNEFAGNDQISPSPLAMNRFIRSSARTPTLYRFVFNGHASSYRYVQTGTIYHELYFD